MKKDFSSALFVVLFLFALISSILIFRVAYDTGFDNSLTLLSSQFQKGHISLEPTKDMPLGDISPFGGRFYLYFGPLPSIILIPFVALFGKGFPQISIGIISMVVIFYSTYSIFRSFKFKKVDSLWLSLFTVFSTVVFSTGIINISAYQVQVFGSALVFLALREYFVGKKMFWVGIFMALALLTRLNLILGILFFILEFIFKRIGFRQLIIIMIPVFISCVIFGLYNFVRYNSFTETGYSYSKALKTYPISENAKFGYTSIFHMPTNLYSFLVKPPDPLLVDPVHGFTLKFPYFKVNPWGMAIWYTSPLFLVLLYKFKNGKHAISSGLTILALAIPVFTYFSIGFAQFGYRYALDFLPFLIIFLVPSLRSKLGKTEITLITIGVLFNSIYITSLWGHYPHFGI